MSGRWRTDGYRPPVLLHCNHQVSAGGHRWRRRGGTPTCEHRQLGPGREHFEDELPVVLDLIREALVLKLHLHQALALPLAVALLVLHRRSLDNHLARAATLTRKEPAPGDEVPE